MFRLLLTALLVVAPALAYTITSPELNATWTSTGPNPLAWQRVPTDASTFALVLVNDNRTVLPVNNQLIAKSIDGSSASSTTISPTDGQFPLGTGFRVNFVNASDITAIYAQSQSFNIIQGTAVSASASASGSSTATNANTPNPTKTGDVSTHLPSFWGALIAVLAVTLMTT